jgi:hypothetical protein
VADPYKGYPADPCGGGVTARRYGCRDLPCVAARRRWRQASVCCDEPEPVVKVASC